MSGITMFKFFTGGITKSIENIATEWIETDIEKAEAQAIMVKALDPNGKMRRDIAKTVRYLYVTYVVIIAVLILFQAFDISTMVVVAGVETRSVDIAVDNLKELFSPITALFGVITTASFGVNALNVQKGN